MKVFVTGATGFIGSAVVRELLEAGHQVTGLVRSGDSARKLEAIGAQPLHGSIEDLPCLRRGAADADGVIHTAFFHGFSQASIGTRLGVIVGGSPAGIVGRFMTAAVDADRNAIDTFGEALRNGDRSLVIAFPTMAMTPGKVAVETDEADPHAVGGVRAASEKTLLAVAAAGVRAMTVRLPPCVHDETRQGLASMLAGTARKKGFSAYVDQGQNRWGAVHRLDAARLFRLALQDGEVGARYHAVGEEGIAFREIAEAIGSRLGIETRPVTKQQAPRQFSWLSPFVATDNPVSSQHTQRSLGWKPTHSTLLADIAKARQEI